MSNKIVSYAVAANKQKISRSPLQAVHYYNLALALKVGEKVTVVINAQRCCFDRKSLYIRAIELDHGLASAYNNLANLLNPEESVLIQINDRKLRCNQFVLYQLALAYNANYAPAYCNLAVYLQKTKQETLTLTLSGRSVSYTVKELYLEAIYSDPKLSVAYSNLALCLTPECPEVCLRINGDLVVMGERELYIKAIECDACNAEACYNLSTVLQDEYDSVTIHLNAGPIVFDRTKLLVKVLQLNPLNANAYYNLAVFLARTGLKDIEIDLGHLRLYTMRELYLKAIECDDKHFLAMYNLAVCMQPKELVTLTLNGAAVTVDRQRLYLEVIRLKPNHVDAYYNLALTLPTRESVVQVNVASEAHKLTQIQLFELVVGLDAKHQRARSALVALSAAQREG